MEYQELLNRTLAAASVAERDGFTNTAESLREFARLLQEKHGDVVGHGGFWEQVELGSVANTPPA